MGWSKLVLNLIDGVHNVYNTIAKIPLAEVIIDQKLLAEIAEETGLIVKPILNDLGEIIAYTASRATSSNGATTAVSTVVEVIAKDASTVSSGYIAGEATALSVTETGTAIGKTALSTVAGPAIAVSLGIGAGIGLYNISPEFWTSVSDKLVHAGKTIGNKIITFFTGDGTSYYDEETISIIKQALEEAGYFSGESYNPEITDENITKEETDEYIKYTIPKGYKPKVTFKDFALRMASIDTYMLWGTEIAVEDNIINFDNYDDYVVIAGSTNGNSYPFRRTFVYSSLTAGDVYLTVYKNGEDILLENSKFGYYVYYLTISGNSRPGNKEQLRTWVYTNRVTTLGAYANDEIGVYHNFGEFSKNNPDGSDEPLPLPFPVKIPSTGTTGEEDSKKDVYPVPIPDSIPISDEDFETDLSPDPAPKPSENPNDKTDTEPNPDPNPPVDPSKPNDPDNPNDNDDDNGNNPPLVPIPPLKASAISRVYNPSQSELDALGEYMWSSDNIIDILKLFQNPVDGIISLHVIYGTPSVGTSKEIKLGYLPTGVSAPVVTSQFIDVDCGSIEIPHSQLNALDYPPYTDIQIYLPFIGIQSLNAYDLVGSVINCKYRIDVYTGACIAQLNVNRGDLSANLYEFSGNCAYQLPLTSGSFVQMVGNVISGAVAGGIHGGVGGAVLGGAGSLIHSNVEVSRSGNLAANAGILGTRTPYLIITRAVPYDAANYSTFYGYPANKTVYLRNCSGFTRVKSIILHTSANQEERDEILKLLKEGVYI